MADQEQMLLVLKTNETGHEMIDRAFGGQLGDFLEPGFQAKGIGDDLRGLACSDQRTREYSIEGYSQTAKSPRRPAYSFDSFRVSGRAPSEEIPGSSAATAIP